ncbi:carnitine dehydratase [Planococcus kocurii]|uniref:Carnitine dehydratase n=1 Tax=Planococcus kocurii TaxID=1374 RepID=A0ABM5WTI3_9BACL|nr:CaiB/BaiF CoA-transferase family protein [Planococcus kocurii]ALS77619.1 carnitine dehydratase [Planococcus kocurii]
MGLLNNLKILDFSTLLPGPFATLMLADLGAEVLHVQRPTEEKLTSMENYLNRSKKSIALNLKDETSIEKLKELVKEYDIVLEQFRPGVMDRLGLGYEQLKKINPRVIYCSLTGFGQTGPYRDRPGHDINYVSIAGLASYSGTERDGPANVGTQIADIAGGSLHAAIGILSAFIYRERTGEGQSLDISMTDCSMSLNAIAAAPYLVDGEKPAPEKMLLNGGTFYGYFKTKDDRYVSVGSLEPKFRILLCEGLGRTDLIELSMSQKPNDIADFKQAVKESFLNKTFKEWNEIFGEIEACVEPVLTLEEVMHHPHSMEREMFVDVPDLQNGFQKQIACPIKSSVFTPEYKHIGLRAGANNREFF